MRRKSQGLEIGYLTLLFLSSTRISLPTLPHLSIKHVTLLSFRPQDPSLRGISVKNTYTSCQLSQTIASQSGEMRQVTRIDRSSILDSLEVDSSSTRVVPAGPLQDRKLISKQPLAIRSSNLPPRLSPIAVKQLTQGQENSARLEAIPEVNVGPRTPLKAESVHKLRESPLDGLPFVC